ncbi:hypothetical protein PSN45_001754 [Yamadazyma tenuis]|uniref:Uncharacterized protein n=1 Tax=Candida tenuis (strain ATCC 10573 / BCRC 21748 / CBS 615 / JCM 9827 / NBRC 10315 / NRRL Y-1498 / VKM Y-70) TaxID=590646 RepID=G3BE96_CANTC|nr:uncharacterized protein CANTEDRAFT_127772 [Yamadazyma tenuis ATCC 10573]EGV60494.1 hypothetical protein CANTEDRAFT_127772 [Yamadazyma tenuis ATCC 10573]WEJ94270.1 hypothetical protein PSN45_001754 [Yamadazyma tenuis]
MTKTREYSASDGILNMLYALQNGADTGSGIRPMRDYGKNLLGSKLPPAFIQRAVSNLNNLFGNYPVTSDYAPSVLFTVIFIVLGTAHFTLFTVNVSRGHLFYISFAWGLIAWLKGVGFALRSQWALDILQVNIGLASEVILIVSGVFLSTVNLVLAQRLFTWRHPVGGDRKLFKNIMYGMYVMVVAVIVGTVFAQASPYVNFVGPVAFQRYGKAVKGTSILIISYSLTAISLVLMSYFFKPTRKDENLYTYQPWWVESFHPFYFVKKNASREAEETFMKRNHNHRHAVRVIAATHHHFNMVEGLSNERGDLTHNYSIIIVTITTAFTFVESILRCITCFQMQPSWNNSPLCKPIVAYICWGVLETLAHIFYLVGRVDLRFYKPDILPVKIRSIITAEQSFFASRNISQNVSDEEESEAEDMDDFSYTESPPSRTAAPPGYEFKNDKLEESTSNDNESDFNF